MVPTFGMAIMATAVALAGMQWSQTNSAVFGAIQQNMT